MDEYTPPIVAVDAVLLSIIGSHLEVLLHLRPYAPFEGSWALPGAYYSKGDDLQAVLRRTIDQKVDVQFTSIPYFEQLYTFDAGQRDPRGPTISVSYMGLIQPETFHVQPEENAGSRFFGVNQLPELAFDHESIIGVAVNRLRSKLLYTDMIKYILPKQCTLTQIQEAYEQIIGLKFDKRNFRKKFLALDVLEASPHKLTGATHRPAQLYGFKGEGLTEFTKAFI